jgi:chemotaxis protein histidine kinase CheA
LYPPLTALEVVGSKVEGAVLVVSLRPTLKEPRGVLSGVDDLKRLHEERLQAAERAEASKAELQKLKTEAKQQESLRQRQALWRERMHEVKHLANRKLIAQKEAEVAELELRLKRATLSSRWAQASGGPSVAEQEEQARALEEAEKRLQQAMASQASAEKKAAAAAAREKKANAEKEKAEKKLGEQSNKLSAMYGQAQFMRGVMRAKEAAKVYESGEAGSAAADAEAEAGARPREYGPIHEAAVEEVQERMRLVIGPTEQWAVDGINAEDVSMGEKCCERLVELCGKRGKERKLAIACGVVEALADLMRKYSGATAGLPPQGGLLYQACLALGAITKKAEAEELQVPASACLHSLVPCLDLLMKPGMEAVQSITRNDKECTMKLVRAGGDVAWLADDSSIVRPEQGELRKKMKEKEKR